MQHCSDFYKNWSFFAFFQFLIYKTLKIKEKYIFEGTVGISSSSSIEWYPESQNLGRGWKFVMTQTLFEKIIKSRDIDK